MPNSVNLPPDLHARLQREAERLNIDLERLLAGLVEEYLKRPTSGRTANRRTQARVKVSASAMLHFSSENGREVLYRAGDLKDAAPGGVRIECDASFPVESLVAAGRKFELIFQPREDEPPLRLKCEVCRISRQGGKTILGVSFSEGGQELSPETIQVLAARPEKRKE